MAASDTFIGALIVAGAAAVADTTAARRVEQRREAVLWVTGVVMGEARRAAEAEAIVRGALWRGTPVDVSKKSATAARPGLGFRV